jgi:hypothetical protein
MLEMVPSSLDRVRAHTAPEINSKIDKRIEENIRKYATLSRAELSERISELEKEWDMEQILEANASTLAFVGTMLAVFVNKRFLIIPAFVTAFLFQHAVQGWCPPVPIFRRLGRRTRNEIDAEKFALKALRGDFERLCNASDRIEFTNEVINAVRAS